MTFDLAGEPVAVPRGVRTSLVFTLNGGPWPRGASGASGSLRLQPRDGSPALVLDMPTGADGRLEVELPLGLYDVTWERGSDWDWSRYPGSAAGGVLKVVAEGEVRVDVPASTVQWSVSVDGNTVASVPADTQSFELTLYGERTPSMVRRFAAGETLGGSWVVPPDNFRGSFQYISYEPTSPFPSGRQTGFGPVAARAGETVRLVYAIRTAEVSGTITIDGESYDGDAKLVGEGVGSYTLPVTQGQFAGRVLPGTYAVFFTPDSRAGFGGGKAVVQESFAAPGRLARDLTSVMVSGSITLNQGTPAEGSRGSLKFVSASGGTGSVSVGYSGDASYEGRVFSGTYDVYVDGGGRVLPGPSRPVATGWRAVSTPRTYNVEAKRLDATMLLDGRPILSTGDSAGMIMFTPVEPNGQPVADRGQGSGSEVLLLPSSGQASGQILLQAGRWQATYHAFSGGPVPQGSKDLGILDVSTNMARTWNVESVGLTVRLQRQRSWLPESSGENRGKIMFGGAQVPIPRSGPSEVQMRVLRSAGSLFYQCEDTTWCANAGLGPFTILVDGLEL